MSNNNSSAGSFSNKICSNFMETADVEAPQLAGEATTTPNRQSNEAASTAASTSQTNARDLKTSKTANVEVPQLAGEATTTPNRQTNEAET